MHTCIFIEAQGSRQILCIHAKADLVFATLIKFIERVTQEGKSNTALTPFARHTQCAHPTHSGFFKGLLDKSEVIAERITLRLVHSSSVGFWDIGAQSNALRELCFWNRRIHF